MLQPLLSIDLQPNLIHVLMGAADTVGHRGKGKGIAGGGPKVGNASRTPAPMLCQHQHFCLVIQL